MKVVDFQDRPYGENMYHDKIGGGWIQSKMVEWFAGSCGARFYNEEQASRMNLALRRTFGHLICEGVHGRETQSPKYSIKHIKTKQGMITVRSRYEL